MTPYREKIYNNPFRILGVYANASIKDIKANEAKAKAFLNVGKDVTFPCDFNQIMPLLERTPEMMESANAQLTLPNEKIKYALLWFVKVTPLDEIAFNHLENGNFEQTLNIWRKKECFSSLLNISTLALIHGHYLLAIDSIIKMLESEKHRQDFISSVVDETFQISAEELIHSFLDVLISDSIIPLLESSTLSEAYKEYIKNKVVKPIIDEVETEITKSKSIKRENSSARYNAGIRLMNLAKSKLAELKKLLVGNDMRYQIIADKLGLEILQCGIDYYNNSDDADAAHKAMKIQSYAQSVVIGQMAKDRCEKNLSILKGIISKLPPLEVNSAHKAIQHALFEYSMLPDDMSYSIDLMKKCAEYIVLIKSFVGIENSYYLDISTKIVNSVLSNVIDVVNSTLSDETNSFDEVRIVLKTAWKAILYMDKFDMESSFRSDRYNVNRKSLYNIIAEAKGFEDPSLSYMYTYGCGFCYDIDVSDLDLRTEDELFRDCKSVEDCKLYIEKYPSGKNIDKIRFKLHELQLNQCKTIKDYETYISTCTITSLKKKAIDKLEILKKQEEERKARLRAQEEAISKCINLQQLIELYTKEKGNNISADTCSKKAFELCTTEEDYTRLINKFGAYTIGGKLAKQKLKEIETKKLEQEEISKRNRKRLLLIMVPIIALTTIFFVWGLEGICVTCYIIAAIAGFIAFGILRSFDTDGCGVFFISAAIAGIFGFTGYGLSAIVEEIKDKRESTELYEQIIINPTTDLCSKYIKKYHYSENSDNVRSIWLNKLVDEAKSYNYKSEIGNLLSGNHSTRTPLQKLLDFANDNKSNEFGTKATKHLEMICDSLYESADKTATIDAWRTFQKAVPSKFWQDSEYKINEIENKSWNTESKAWKTAVKENTISAYRKYKLLYPNGQHYPQAEKKLIELEVSDVFASGNYGQLPSMDRTGYSNSTYSTVSVRNDTQYTLTLLYSGVESKRLVISPHSSKSVRLKSGSYRIVASVNASNVRNFAGREELMGGSYDVSYYIQTSRF